MHLSFLGIDLGPPRIAHLPAAGGEIFPHLATTEKRKHDDPRKGGAEDQADARPLLNPGNETLLDPHWPARSASGPPAPRARR